MSVLLEFAIFPTDKGESVSEWVSKVIAHIRETGVEYQLTPMGTIIETETLDAALEVVKGCYGVLESDCDRVYATFTVDIRRGELGRMSKKINAIEERIGTTKH